MFFTDLAKCISGLLKMQRDHCHYGNPNRCDCKYGVENGGSEQSGCPELRMAAEILGAMTKAEFKRIQMRIDRRTFVDLLRQGKGAK